jgi:PAS domain S-box-containing protein
LSEKQVRIPGLLREVVESIDGGVLLLDGKGRVLITNRELGELFGITQEKVIQDGAKQFLRFVAERLVDQEAYLALADEKFKNPDTEREDMLELKDGRTFTRHMKPFKLAKSVPGFLLIFRDITSQRHMKRELERKSAFLEALSESTLEGILVVDNEGKKLLTNPQLVKTWGLPQHLIDDRDDQAQLRFVVALLKDPDLFLQKVTYLYAHPAEHSRDEIEFTNGTTLDRYSAPVIGKDGTHYGRIWSFRDITELVEARRAAETASLVKSRFLANMSHEIRTPLNGVIGLTSVLMESNLDADTRDVVSTIQSSGETLLRVINDVLDFSKIEAGEFEIDPSITNLEELCKDVVALYQRHATERGIVLQAVGIGENGRQFDNMLIDSVRVRQVLSNLLLNAVKFTHRGEVKLEWGVELRGSQPIVRFCVSDTGIGIRPERLQAIFESFTQANAGIHRKYGGTGLGLAISKRLIELMGGEIGATSLEGVGSKFWAEIPVEIVQIASEAPVVLRDCPNYNFEGLRVLLVEDNVVNVKVALRMLERSGLKADVAENGMVAISMVQDNDYDLVLMDVMMPICDGLEATRVIRSNEESRGKSALPIIALTANGIKGDRELCVNAGMSDFLSKPITIDQLQRVLNKWLPNDRLASRAA